MTTKKAREILQSQNIMFDTDHGFIPETGFQVTMEPDSFPSEGLAELVVEALETLIKGDQ
jgi:hypothetical protein